MLPLALGAVAAIVKAAAPLVLVAGIGALSVTAQVRLAPAALGSVPQLTALTPVPAVTELATTPAGSASATVSAVPLAVPPLLPSPIVYVSPPFTVTVA